TLFRSHHTIPKAAATTRFSGLDAPAQTTMRFLRQVVEVKGIHRALKPDVERRNFTIGTRDDLDAAEGELLEQPGGVLLVAAEAVERLRTDNLESAGARVVDQRLNALTNQRRTGDAVV